MFILNVMDIFSPLPFLSQGCFGIFRKNSVGPTKKKLRILAHFNEHVILRAKTFSLDYISVGNHENDLKAGNFIFPNVDNNI